MSGFEVIKSGIFTLIQDKGRYGLTHLGVSNSGVMDEYAALMAQKMLDNDLDTNILEIVFGNVELKASTDTVVCITGAKCEFSINDVPSVTWKTYKVTSGDTLKIGKVIEGQRVYLCVKNGFDIKNEFGSCSTTIKEELGGLNGKQLKKGDELSYKKADCFYGNRLKEEHIPKYEEEVLTLRVVLSYQEDSFSQEEKDKFFSSTYKITPDFNRMACRLSGEEIHSDLNGIISEGISFGSIQIPKNGQPIILLKERQTIGGYPKIGSVLSIDCFKLAQRKVASQVRFEEIDIQTAQSKLKDFYNVFNDV